MFDLLVENDLLPQCCQNGFSAVAVTHRYLKASPIPQPQQSSNVLSLAKNKRPALEKYSRIHVHLDETNANAPIANAAFLSYDIISVTPTNEKLFALACQQLDIDIISIDMSQRLDYHFKMPNINMAIARGIHFEVTYGGSLRDASCKRNLFANATTLFKATKGRNVIVSSDAKNIMQLRRPTDVINLCSLFGMSQSQARDALTVNCRAVIIHGGIYILDYLI